MLLYKFYLKAPPLPPVPNLVAIEILISKYVFGTPFLRPLWSILAPRISLAHPRSPSGSHEVTLERRYRFSKIFGRLFERFGLFSEIIWPVWVWCATPFPDLPK